MLRNSPEALAVAPYATAFLLGAMSVYLWRQNRELKHAATHDELTGLLNSRGLEQFLTDKESRQALLYIDGTNQKSVNDNLGHERGDEAIIGTVNVIEGALRKYDVAARIGGDEFVVVLNDDPKNYRKPQAVHTKKETLDLVKNRMAERTEAYLDANPDLVEVGFHIAVGGTVWQPGMTIEEVRTAAEIDMYMAKGHQHEQLGKHRD